MEGGAYMISIIYKDGFRNIHGEAISMAESWEGIGEYWNGYAALLTDIVDGARLMTTENARNEFNRIIDEALFADLDTVSRDALCFYYGLQAHTKHALGSVTVCLNALSFGGVHYNDSMTIKIIREAIIKLSKCPEIREYICRRTNGELFGAAQ